jgi:release factor glutamine methyltransferase
VEKVSNIIPYFIKQLSDIAPDSEIISWAYLSIEHCLDYNRSDCIIHSEQEITSLIANRLKQITTDLKTNKPIQYILGKTDFYGLKLKVNEHTLIPRPETEELVDWVLKQEFSSALDIGTGSGCIPIALAKHTNASIMAIDVSENALEVAKENAILNTVKVKFILQDILHSESLPKVDLIVSNPPYVLDNEKVKMQKNVLDFEPDLALFVANNNPLIFYKKIAQLAFESLNENGKLFFEINEQFGADTIAMLTEIGFVNIALKKDINDKDRMVKATKK